MRSLVITPTYNEAENIEPIVREVLKQVPSGLDILVVDDGSPDGTGEVADRLANEFEQVHVLHRTEKAGLGKAYVAGFRWGMEREYDVLVEMDADFSHHPTYLPTMLEQLQKHHVVIGSRYVDGGGTKNWGFIRKLISRGGSLYSRVILGAGLLDFTGGFNGWRREVLDAINLDTLRSDGYSFQIELKYRAYLSGFSIHEFPIIFEDRKVGQSKMSKKIFIEAMYRVWQLRMNHLGEKRTAPVKLLSE
jgi:dolichol-phosphate mannosyltransferase